jgi:outer membrane protein assembly factor BamB
MATLGGARSRLVLAAACAALPLTVAASAASPATAPEASPDAWPMFRGGSALNGVARSTLAAAPTPRWTFQAGGGIESSAAIVDGVVFVGSLDGQVYALDLGSGAVKWKYAADDAVKSSPSVLSGVVYVGDEKGTLHAIDAATGTRRWVFHTEAGIVSSPNLAGGRLVFGSYDNFLYCLTLDGKLAWKLETAGYVHATPAVTSFKGQPAAIVAGCDAMLRIVRIEDGVELGHVPLGGYVGASPAVRAGRAYVGNFESQVHAIDLESGKVAWTYSDPERQFPFYASPALKDDLLVVCGRDKQVHALRPGTGKRVWVVPTRGRIDASPVFSGDRVYIGVTTGDLLALDAATGKTLWQFETGSAITASPAIAAGRLVIGNADGAVFCFG